MQCNIISLEYFFQARQGNPVFFGKVYLRDVWVITDYIQAKGLCLPGHHSADGAASHNTERLPVNGTHPGLSFLGFGPAALADQTIQHFEFLGAG